MKPLNGAATLINCWCLMVSALPSLSLNSTPVIFPVRWLLLQTLRLLNAFFSPVSNVWQAFIFLCCHLGLINTATGEGAPEEDGSPPAHEHLPAPGNRPDAARHPAGAEHLDGSQAGHRRDHHHEWEPEGCTGLHVWCTHPCPLDEGAFRELRPTDCHTFDGYSLYVQVQISFAITVVMPLLLHYKSKSRIEYKRGQWGLFPIYIQVQLH